jgi:hypothetical protein
MDPPGTTGTLDSADGAARAVARLRATYESGATRALSWRRDQLARLRRVATRPDPLALYAFSASRRTVQEVIARTRSGGVCVNGTVLQIAVPQLPYGGVGHSGSGAYHGRTGFEQLSRARGVLVRPRRFDVRLIYPPYRRAGIRLLRFAERWPKPPRSEAALGRRRSALRA